MVPVDVGGNPSLFAMAHWTSWRRSPSFQGGETGSKPVCATKFIVSVHGARQSLIRTACPDRYRATLPTPDRLMTRTPPMRGRRYRFNSDKATNFLVDVIIRITIDQDIAREVGVKVAIL